jgi:protein-S-isoprenylcysteine O-methyltransferase Ste14
MKVQIEKFSVHQNAKVFAVLMALSSLVMVIPFMLIVSMSAPEGAFPLFMLFVFPLMYLVFGYVMVAIGCWLYNWIAKRMGGLEYESRNLDEAA